MGKTKPTAAPANEPVTTSISAEGAFDAPEAELVQAQEPPPPDDGTRPGLDPNAATYDAATVVPAGNRLFTKKPVTIEAMLYTDDSVPALTAWMQQAGFDGYSFANPDGIVINTLEGQHLGRRGDWIIKGVAGEFYPCKPEIFAATYDAGEPAEPTAPEGRLAWEAEWNACLALAFTGTGADMLTDWGNIPFTLSQHFYSQPDAPAHAALMQVQLTHKCAILPHEDPRRVELALQLMRSLVCGLDAIEREDATRQQAAAEASNLALLKRSTDHEGTMLEKEDERFELSTTGKALAAQDGNQG